MTGPLAQQFAHVRESVEYNAVKRAVDAGLGASEWEACLLSSEKDALAALSVIERHVQDTEKALLFYAERRNYRPATGGHHDVPLGGWMEVRDSYDGRGAGARARAVLSAREKGTE